MSNRRPKFSIEMAKEDGRTDEEITEYLASQNPNFNVQMALDDGRSYADINEHLANPPKKERSTGEKAARLGMQAALSAGEMAVLPYEIANMASSSESQMTNENLKRMGEDVESYYELYGSEENWPPEVKEQYEFNKQRLQKPELAAKEIEGMGNAANIGVRGTFEKLTGVDTHPEGFLEKGVAWLAMLKEPKKAVENLKNLKINPVEFFKELIPGTKTLRSAGAAAGLEMAEEGYFGVPATIAAALMGDVLGMGPAGIKYAITHPKEVVARAVNFFTRDNSKTAWKKDIINEANKAGIQLDAGTLTQSKIIQMAQARAVQSGLSGAALDNFRKSYAEQIMQGYKKTIDHLGELSFENNHQAAEALKGALKTEEVRLNAFKGEQQPSRSLQGRVSTEPVQDYRGDFLNSISPEVENTTAGGQRLKAVADEIRAPIKEDFNRRYENFNERIGELPAGPQAELVREMETFVENHRGSLLLGESSAEAGVVQAAQRLVEELQAGGGFRGVTVDQLLKTKRTLQDVANWDFGGSNFESAYKKLVGDVDAAIERTLAEQSPEMLGEFRALNEDYRLFKETFENKNVLPLFEPNNNNFNAIYNGFASNPDKIRHLEAILNTSPEGQQVLNQVKRDYAQSVIDKPQFTPRDFRNLINTLGGDFAEQLGNYAVARERALANPLPRARTGEPMGIRPREAPIQIERPQTQATKPIGKVSETGVSRADEALRRKTYESLKNADGSFKSSDQIMKQMDTIEGIRKLRRALSTTPEGQQVFNEMARYKLGEMIDKKMHNVATDQLKHKNFSTLFKTTKERAILKELVGNEAYEKIIRLQKLSGAMAESAEKFFNASKSGVVLEDMAMAGTTVMGVLTMNPALFLKGAGSMFGYYTVAKLFGDPKFLNLLEKVIMSNDRIKYLEYIKQMEPSVKAALLASQQNNKNQ